MTDSIAFAQPECCDLGPVKVSQVLEVLRAFAETAQGWDDASPGIPDEQFTDVTLGECRAARSLYLKLGGKL